MAAQKAPTVILGHRPLPAALVLATAAALLLTACGGGAATNGGAATSSAPTVSATGSPSTGSSSPGTAGTAGGGGGASVTYTWDSPRGPYVYQVSLTPAGVTSATTFTTNDSSGTGGTTIDAPPGKTLLVATLNFANNTGDQEPLPDVSQFTRLPSSGVFQWQFAIPQTDAAAFGLPDVTKTDVCGVNVFALGGGYCSLGARLAGYSPARNPWATAVQLAPGATGTMTIVSHNVYPTMVPQDAPLKDVKVFVTTNTSCDVYKPGCYAPLN